MWKGGGSCYEGIGYIPFISIGHRLPAVRVQDIPADGHQSTAGLFSGLAASVLPDGQPASRVPAEPAAGYRQAEQPEGGAHHDLLHLAGQHGQAIPRLCLHDQGGQGRADHRAHPYRDGCLHPGDENDSGQPVPEGGCRAEEGAEGGGTVVVGQAKVEGDGVRAGYSGYN